MAKSSGSLVIRGREKKLGSHAVAEGVPDVIVQTALSSEFDQASAALK
jgi:hypothetical protein